ncbi:MAG: hypothetical protein FD153_1576 [Rhodospirillaceae bacterium]|nr:MAG: hypothetical protein FD153_1576 [Rhodospirillaceae bacterium]
MWLTFDRGRYTQRHRDQQGHTVRLVARAAPPFGPEGAAGHTQNRQGVQTRVAQVTLQDTPQPRTITEKKRPIQFMQMAQTGYVFRRQEGITRALTRATGSRRHEFDQHVDQQGYGEQYDQGVEQTQQQMFHSGLLSWIRFVQANCQEIRECTSL